MKHLFNWIWHGENVGRRLGTSIVVGISYLTGVGSVTSATSFGEFMDAMTPVSWLTLASAVIGSLLSKKNGEKNGQPDSGKGNP